MEGNCNCSAIMVCAVCMSNKKMATVGTFTLIKNEASWIKAHLISWLPSVDQMVLFDGGSTDGTLEIIKKFKEYPNGDKITLVEGMDPKNLGDSYVSMFDECLHTLDTEYAIFAHPDMILDDPGHIRGLGDKISYFSHIRSFAGEPGGQLKEIVSGRSKIWKNIYRLRKPDLGLHYWGHYGATEEDCYFRAITGNSHDVHLKKSTGIGGSRAIDIRGYPYDIGDSGIRILHYSDVRTKERRIDRMVKCLISQGFDPKKCSEIASTHPRVTLKDSAGVKFSNAEYHHLLREKNGV